MNLNDIPLFSMLKGKLSYETQRQQLLAQNVANADTPGYAPRDLKAFSFDQVLKSAQSGSGATQATLTNAAHIPFNPSSSAGGFGNQDSPDSEVRLDGNRVVLEEQMMKVNQAQGDYNAAIGFYQQSMLLLKTALKKPGS